MPCPAKPNLFGRLHCGKGVFRDSSFIMSLETITGVDQGLKVYMLKNPITI